MNQHAIAKIPEMSTAGWITWEVQVRNRSMSSLLKIPLYELILDKHRAIRYPALVIKTLQLIYKNDIRILFVQNPSIVLSMLAVMLLYIRKMVVVVDAHNSGIYPLEGKSKLLCWMAKFIARRANAVIVSNSYLAEAVKNWGANPVVMPDPIPALHSDREVTFSKPYVFFICTWAADEPYLEIIKAAELISQDIDIYITGKYVNKLSTAQIKNLPKNIKLLGFVPEDDYVAYFKSSILAIDLTTRDNCLVCGAYEALSLGKPCVVSDSKVNREVFKAGFIYTENNSVAIAEAINHGCENIAKYNDEITTQATNHKLLIEERVSKLKMILQ